MGATAHYAFNVPISGAFNDIRGFAKVRFGQKAKSGSVREIDINGDFKTKEPISKLLNIVKASSFRSAKGSVFSCYPAGSSFKLPFAVLCDAIFAIF